MPTSNKPKIQKNSEKPAATSEASSRRESTNGLRASDITVSAAKDGAPLAPAPETPPTQGETFAAAVQAFRAGKLQESRALFCKAGEGSDRAMALSAKQHVQMCDRRLAESTVLPSTPEEHYNCAVALINSRELSLARRHLEAALAQDGQADHIHYAMALCRALAGDLQGAYENLKCAIELQPNNRLTARQDADFAGLADRPPLDRLVYPERKNSS